MTKFNIGDIILYKDDGNIIRLVYINHIDSHDYDPAVTHFMYQMFTCFNNPWWRSVSGNDPCGGIMPGYYAADYIEKKSFKLAGTENIFGINLTDFCLKKLLEHRLCEIIEK